MSCFFLARFLMTGILRYATRKPNNVLHPKRTLEGVGAEEAVDAFTSHEREKKMGPRRASSKQDKAGTAVNQFRKLKFPDVTKSA